MKLFYINRKVAFMGGYHTSKAKTKYIHDLSQAVNFINLLGLPK